MQNHKVKVGSFGHLKDQITFLVNFNFTILGTVFAACVADFFSNMARKVVDFQALLLGAFFVPVFGPGLLTCAARVPIFGPKIWTPSRGQKHNSDCNYLCPLLWRPVALELWSGFMNVC